MLRIGPGFLILVLTLAPGLRAEASALARVLGRIAEMGASPLAAVMMNVAETVPDAGMQARPLRPGDTVVIGYASDGEPVTATAGPLGVQVAPEMAARLATGLAAGLYPVGSALHSLPPAGQLSLMAQAADGRRLDLARELVLSRIDGSVTTIVKGLLLPDLAPAMLVTAQDGWAHIGVLDMGALTTTVLGTVNAGELATNIRAEWSPEALASRIDLALAAVDSGSALALDAAQGGNAAAGAASSRVLGGVEDSRALLLNLSSNAMAVTGAVALRVDGASIAAAGVATTVLGAVNGGGIDGAPPR